MSTSVPFVRKVLLISTLVRPCCSYRAVSGGQLAAATLPTGRISTSTVSCVAAGMDLLQWRVECALSSIGGVVEVWSGCLWRFGSGGWRDPSSPAGPIIYSADWSHFAKTLLRDRPFLLIGIVTLCRHTLSCPLVQCIDGALQSKVRGWTPARLFILEGSTLLLRL